MYPNKEDLTERYHSNVGAVLNFISNGKVVSIVGDLYSIRLIMKTRENFWLRFPVEWCDYE